MVLILSLTIVFLNSVPKIPSLGELAPETLKCFVLNETRYVIVFKGAHSELDNCFLKFCSQNTYIEFVPKRQSALFQMKLSTQGYSRMLTLNLAISFLNSVFKTPFLGKFGPETQKYFVLNQTWFLGMFHTHDHISCVLHITLCLFSFREIEAPYVG